MDEIQTIVDYQTNPYSWGSYYCECFFNDNKLSNATCFFITRDEQIYLVSNYHVLSGYNAETEEVLHKTGATPNRIRVYMPKLQDGNILLLDDNTYQDYDLMDGNYLLWKYLRINEIIVDVALLQVEIPDGFIINTVDELEQPFNENTEIKVAYPVFIIGFPFGKLGGDLPIWKKASVASEPIIDLKNGLPFFWADTATREGMSGSPVIYYERRPITIRDEARKEYSDAYTKFVGIYSGRFDKNENDAQLGRVWKSSCIDKILGLV